MFYRLNRMRFIFVFCYRVHIMSHFLHHPDYNKSNHPIESSHDLNWLAIDALNERC